MIASVLCAVTVGQAALADAAATSLWSERRRAIPLAVQNDPLSLPPLPRPSLSSSRSPIAGAAFASAIPAHLGTLRFVGAASAPVSVLLIQDIHMNPEAQEHIAGALSSLFASHAVDLVGLEGADGALGFDRLAHAPDPASLSLAADFLLERNEISGAARAALAPGVSTPVLGLDDGRLHEENAQAYRRSVPSAAALKSALETRRAELARAKRDCYNPTLRSFDETVGAYRDHRQPFVDYARTLLFTAHRLKIAPPNGLEGFVSLATLEKSLDTAAVERERTLVLSRLAGALDETQARRLLELGNAFRAGLIRHAAFYAEFAAICRASRVDLSATPALSSYLRYIAESDAIDPDATLRDASVLESALYAALGRTKDERRLIEADRRAYLTSRLVSFEMTRPEWEEYDGLRKADGVSPEASGRRAALASFEDFYRVAIQRDAAIADRLFAAIEQRHARRIAVVAGGFHASGLLRRLTSRGIAAAVFTPGLSKAEGDGAAYLSVFTREKTPIENLLEGRALFLAQNPLPPAAVFAGAHLEAARGLSAGQPAGPQLAYVERATGFHVVDEHAAPGAPVRFDERAANGKPVRVTVSGVTDAGFTRLPDVETRASRRWLWSVERAARQFATRALSAVSRLIGGLASALQPAPLTVNEEIRYQRAQTGDWDAIVRLRRVAFPGPRIVDDPTEASRTEREVESVFRSITVGHTPGLVVVARRGSDVVGYAIATVATGGMATIRELVVDADHQGQGIGKAIFAGALTTLLRDHPHLREIHVSDGHLDRRTTDIAREFGFEEYVTRELRLSVSPETIPTILERIAQRVSPRDPAEMERSRARLADLRAFLVAHPHPEILGVLVTGDVASGRSRDDSTAPLLLLTQRGSLFNVLTPDELRFHFSLVSRFPWIQHVPLGAVSVGQAGPPTDAQALDMAIRTFLLPAELSGAMIAGNPLPGAPLVQDWVIVGRSLAEETEMTELINTRVAELRDDLQARQETAETSNPAVPAGPILPFIGNHFGAREQLSFADLETGSGRFVGAFRRLLERSYARVDAVGVESDPQYVTERDETILHARPVLPGAYEAVGLADASRDIVTINTIESNAAANAVIDQAVRIVRPDGLIIVTFEQGDIESGTMIENQVIDRLYSHGFRVELHRFPTDYPRSDVFAQYDDFIMVARRPPPEAPAPPTAPPGLGRRILSGLARAARALGRAIQPAFLMVEKPVAGDALSEPNDVPFFTLDEAIAGFERRIKRALEHFQGIRERRTADTSVIDARIREVEQTRDAGRALIERLRERASDPDAFIAELRSAEDERPAILNQAIALAEQWIPGFNRRAYFATTPTSVLGLLLDPDLSLGGMATVGLPGGETVRVALINTSLPTPLDTLIAVVHEEMHRQFFPFDHSVGWFERYLNEGMTEFMTRRHIASILARGRSAAVRNVRVSVPLPAVSSEESLLRSVFGTSPRVETPLERFRRTYGERSGYKHQLAVVDSLARRLGEDAIVQAYESRQMPAIAGMPALDWAVASENVLSRMKERTAWRLISYANTHVGPWDAAAWNAMTRVLDAMTAEGSPANAVELSIAFVSYLPLIPFASELRVLDRIPANVLFAAAKEEAEQAVPDYTRLAYRLVLDALYATRLRRTHYDFSRERFEGIMAGTDPEFPLNPDLRDEPADDSGSQRKPLQLPVPEDRSPWIADPEVTVAQATAADLDAILAIRHAHLFPDLISGWAADPKDEMLRSLFRRIVVTHETGGVFFTLRRNGIIIGYACAQTVSFERASLAESAVLPGERGRGFGRALFAERLRYILSEFPSVTEITVGDGSQGEATGRTAATFGFDQFSPRHYALELTPGLRQVLLHVLSLPPTVEPPPVLALNKHYIDRYLNADEFEREEFPFETDYRWTRDEMLDDVGFFRPTSVMDAVLLFAAAGLRPGMTVVDAGGGDGRVAMTAAALGAHATSVEADPTLHALAVEMRDTWARRPGHGSITLVNGDFANQDLSKADIVYYAHDEPRLLAAELERQDGELPNESSFHKAQRQFVRQLKPGAIIILTSSPETFTDPSLQPFVPAVAGHLHSAYLRPRFYRKVGVPTVPQATPATTVRTGKPAAGPRTSENRRSPLLGWTTFLILTVANRFYRAWRAAVVELRLTANIRKFIFRDHDNLEFWGWQKRAVGVALIYVGMIYLPLKLGLWLAAATTLDPSLIVAIAVASIPIANIFTHGVINTLWLIVEPVHLLLLWASRHLEQAAARAAARAAAAALEPAPLIAKARRASKDEGEVRPPAWALDADGNLKSAEELARLNHFDVLGLPRTASATEVKKAYRRLSRLYYPDLWKSAWARTPDGHKTRADRVFERLRSAFEALKDVPAAEMSVGDVTVDRGFTNPLFHLLPSDILHSGNEPVVTRGVGAYLSGLGRTAWEDSFDIQAGRRSALVESQKAYADWLNQIGRHLPPEILASVYEEFMLHLMDRVRGETLAAIRTPVSVNADAMANYESGAQMRRKIEAVEQLAARDAAAVHRVSVYLREQIDEALDRGRRDARRTKAPPSLPNLDVEPRTPAVNVYEDDQGQLRIALDSIPDDERAIIERFRHPALNGRIALAGGFVRDLLIGRPFHDTDVLFPQGVADNFAFMSTFFSIVFPGLGPNDEMELGGRPVEVFITPETDGQLPDAPPDYSFNRMLLRFDDQADPLLIDAERGFADLFPAESRSVARVVGDVQRANDETLSRLVRRAGDSDLDLYADDGTLEMMSDLADSLLAKVADPFTAYSPGERRFFRSIVDGYRRWLYDYNSNPDRPPFDHWDATVRQYYLDRDVERLRGLLSSYANVARQAVWSLQAILRTSANSDEASAAIDALGVAVWADPAQIGTESFAAVFTAQDRGLSPLLNVRESAANFFRTVAERLPDRVSPLMYEELGDMLLERKLENEEYSGAAEALGALIENRPDLAGRETVRSLERFIRREGHDPDNYEAAAVALKALAKARPDLIQDGSLTRVIETFPNRVLRHSFRHYRIYNHVTFPPGTTPETRYSVGLAAFRILERHHRRLTSGNARRAVKAIEDERARVSGDIVAGPGYHVVRAVHAEDRFDGDRLGRIAERTGIAASDISPIYKGRADKDRILADVASTVGPLLFMFAGHGSEQHIWLEDGHAGETTVDNFTFDRAINYQELGDALLKNAVILSDRSGLDLSHVTLMIDTCHSYNFVAYLLQYLEKNGVTRPPVLVSSSNSHRFSFDSMLFEQLDRLAPSGPLTFGHLFQAEEGAFRYSYFADFGIFTGESPQLAAAIGGQSDTRAVDLGLARVTRWILLSLGFRDATTIATVGGLLESFAILVIVPSAAVALGAGDASTVLKILAFPAIHLFGGAQVAVQKSDGTVVLESRPVNLRGFLILAGLGVVFHVLIASGVAGAAAHAVFNLVSVLIVARGTENARLAALSRRVAEALVDRTRSGRPQPGWAGTLEADLRSQPAAVGVAAMADRRLPSLAAMDRPGFSNERFLSLLTSDLDSMNALHATEPAAARSAAETVAMGGLERTSADTALADLNDQQLNVVVFDGMRPDDAARTVDRLRADPKARSIVVHDPSNEDTWALIGQVQKLPNVRVVAAKSAFETSATGGRLLRLSAVENRLASEDLLGASLHVFAGRGLELNVDGLPADSPFRAALFTILDAMGSVTANFNRMSLLDASYKLISSQA